MNEKQIEAYRKALKRLISNKTRIIYGSCQPSLEAVAFRDALILFEETLSGEQMSAEDIIDLIPNICKEYQKEI